MYNVIALSKERFASSSDDCTVKIWKDDNTHKCISTLKHNGYVRSIIQLRNKDVLVSCGYKSSTGLSFWNINNYTQQYNIKRYSVYYSSHMIELYNGDIALSSSIKPYPIDFIDSSSYQVKKEIQSKEYIIGESVLCMLNEHSFIYACKGIFLQISSDDYSILYQSKEGRFKGFGGVVLIEGGQYVAIENKKRLTIIKPCYT